VLAWATLFGPDLGIPREQASGMLRPRPGRHDGLARAARALNARGAPFWVLLTDSELANARLEGRTMLLQRRGVRAEEIGWREARGRRRPGEPLFAVVVLATLKEGERPTPQRLRRLWRSAPREEGMAINRRGFLAVMTAPGRRVLLRQRDPDGLLYLALEVRSTGGI